ncbi:MAG: futalosine hydrolase [bacterium]
MPASNDCPTLLLVPTELELRRLEDQGGFTRGPARVCLCGFGPIAAAARTAQLCAEWQPERVLLVGIAGTFDSSRAALESAHEFGTVALTGVGAGEGMHFQGPPALGFAQWPGSPSTTPHPVVESLTLAAPEKIGLLLTSCAATANEAVLARRRAAFDGDSKQGPFCEDMEGFGVALACALACVPLRIVRGVSNEVGDRDPAHWRIPAALDAARCLANTLIEQDWRDGS